MKHLLTALCCLFLFSGVTAQTSNLVFFTEEGERFHVIMNGQRYTESSETNVKIESLQPSSYRVKIVFENEELGEINRTLHLDPDTEYVMNIRERRETGVGNRMRRVASDVNLRKDEADEERELYVLRLLSQNPIAQAAPVQQSQPVQQVQAQPSAPQQRTSTGVTVTETTTHHGTPHGESVRVNVDMNLGGMGGHIHMDVHEHHSHTTTHTTTSHHGHVEPAHPVSPVPGYSGPIGCHYPMSPADFNRAKNSVNSQTFEDSKLTVAKQIGSNNCLLSGQVREMMDVFTFEDSKLEFAKFAYGRTHDLGNYYMVNEAFTFSSSIDELNQYISTR